MDDQHKDSSQGSLGGKTVGTVSGGLFIFISESLPESSPLKPIVLYITPFVAVLARDIGGALLYEARASIRAFRRSRRLKQIELRINNIYGAPEAASFKTQIQKRYYEISSEMLHEDLDEVRQMSKLSAPKNSKGVSGGESPPPIA